MLMVMFVAKLVEVLHLHVNEVTEYNLSTLVTIQSLITDIL